MKFRPSLKMPVDLLIRVFVNDIGLFSEGILFKTIVKLLIEFEQIR